LKTPQASAGITPPEIMTPEEVAQLLRTSRNWVYEKCRSRARDPLPCLRIGRYIRFEKPIILEWARKHANRAARQVAGVGRA
jgi:predicted DNA-binding transcriptional regulator AlpA